MFTAWLIAFAITLVSEMTVAFAVFRAPGVSRLRIVGVAGLASCITHPCLWFILPHYFADYTTYIAVGEILVWLVESLVLFFGLENISLRRAVIYSAVMNLTSYLLGLVLAHYKLI